MMKNIKIILAYDGSNYHGWQDIKAFPSVEAALRKILEKILQEKITLQAASRTDAGVHAKGQVVNFFTKKNLHFPQIERSINGLLPSDIAVLKVEEAPKDFHPTLDCKNKEYHYRVSALPAQIPQNRLYSWHFPYPLDIGLMQRESKALLGTHDFAGFTNRRSDKNYSSTVRELTKVDLIDLPEKQLVFEIRGIHFLYKMIRNIVGYLLYVGCGKLSADLLPTLLRNKDRRLGGITAPAHGLTLLKVDY